MKTLRDILKHTQTRAIHGNTSMEVQDLCIDSRLAETGSLFIAIRGNSSDGHQYIQDVISKGVQVIICEVLPPELHPDVTYVEVGQSARAAGSIAAEFYDHPSASFHLVGITGTNGKTTCATLLYQLFSGMGYTCGLVSTVENRIGERVQAATHTTPDAPGLQKLLAQMRDAGCSYVFMEVSSHSVHQHRIEGCRFAGGCFTNITHDHLDYHGSFDEYIRVKKLFFDELPREAFALVNIDDKRGTVMLQNTRARKRSYSLRTLADYKGKVLENSLNGLVMMMDSNEVFFKMIGEFNAYNLLCVYGVAMELDQPRQDVLRILSVLQGAEGRFDTIMSDANRILGIIDYAHTPDALLNVLATINKLRKGDETLFTVVGCGGNRDKTKRPLMALVACEHSDRVIFTSDNPRNESARSIIMEMEEGVPVNHRKKYLSIEDRKEAIKTACSMARQGDIVLVAGKGHEKYQDIGGVKHAFDDKQILKEMFQLLEK